MSEYQKALQGNIWKLYLLSGLSGAIVVLPIIILFLQENGLSLLQVFILQSIFSASIFVLEIPSGYLSDKWGRKPTLIAGSFASFIAFLIYSYSYTFTAFILAELCLSIGVSFFSGTLDALTYDTLLEQGKEKDFRKISSRQFAAHFGSEAIVSVVGGFLAVLSMDMLQNLRLPMYATVIPFALAFLVSISLHEPKRHKLQEQRHIETIIRIGKDTLLHNIPLRSIIILGGLISSVSYALFWFVQPYQVAAGLPLKYFGVVHAIIVGCGAITAGSTYKLQRWFDDRLLLICIAMGIFVSCIALGFMTSLWGLWFILLIRICWSIKSPLVKDIINKMTTSDVRATVLSINAFGFRILYVCIGPAIGYVADILSLNQAILLFGIFLGISITIMLFCMRNVWSKIPT